MCVYVCVCVSVYVSVFLCICNYLFMYMYVCMHVICVQISKESREGKTIGFLRGGIKGHGELPYRSWDPSLGPVEEQQILLTAESPLQL